MHSSKRFQPNSFIFSTIFCLTLLASAQVSYGQANGEIQPTFEATRLIEFPSVTYGLVAGDFNKDGKPDLAVSTASNISILLGDGTGNFTAHTTLLGGSIQLATADFNRDGNPDLATMSGIFLGDGTGDFHGSVGVVSDERCELAVADFNNDQKPDLATACFGGTVAVFLGDGAGNVSYHYSLSLTDNKRRQ